MEEESRDNKDELEFVERGTITTAVSCNLDDWKSYS